MVSNANTLRPGVSLRAIFGQIQSNVLVQALSVVMISALALGLRLYHLGTWSLWIDEVYSIQRAQGALLSPQVMMPLSHRLMGAVMGVLGNDAWSARLVPALIGVISLPVLYFPIRKLFGPLVALLAILLLSISPWHLFWSQNARFYSALLLFYTLAGYFFYEWLESNRLRYLILAGLFLVLAMAERMVALFLAPVVLAYLLALLRFPFGKPAGFHLKNMILLAAPVLLAALVITPGLMVDLGRTHLTLSQNPLRALASVIYDLGLPLFITGLAGGAYLLVARSRLGLFVFLGAVIPLALLVLISPFTLTTSRYVFATLPNWVILAAVAVKELLERSQKHVRLIAAAALVLLLVEPVSQDWLYYTIQKGNRQDWKGAMLLVRDRKQAGDLVITTKPEMGEYYLNSKVLGAREVDLDALQSSRQTAWFVIDYSTSFVPADLQKWLDENTRLASVNDVYQPGRLMKMRVYLYDPGG